MSRIRGWFFPPVPLARIAILRLFVYAFVPIDVLVLHTSGYYHGWADPVWYKPMLVGEYLQLPAAGVLVVEVLKWGSVVFALLAMTGRFPRLFGWAVAICWIWYQYVAFAYGKVDHDRGDFVLALALLPTVGLAHLSDRRRSEGAGFALRAVQIVAIFTYFLSSWAKLRFGGLEWLDSATVSRAVIRRGTEVGELFLHIPWSLHVMQYVMFFAELTSPVIFLVPERWRRRLVGAWYLFHVAVFATIGIAFWPHLVMMLAFLPLEEYRVRLAGVVRRRLGRGPEPPDKIPVETGAGRAPPP
ncbi:MAG: MFS transporter permease [Streptosporangiales bacterium]|nr:MFS transporter permease [Streptosporangiales bacterium]